jgi:hypothetical protein
MYESSYSARGGIRLRDSDNTVENLTATGMLESEDGFDVESPTSRDDR